jgi:hypothetical protein
MSWVTSSTAATVIIPPNPVLARLLSTPRSPRFRDESDSRLICRSGIRHHWKVPEMLVFGGNVAAVH